MSDVVSPVVVGVDGTLAAIRAARWAAAAAAGLGAPLYIVHATPYLGRNFSDAIANLRAAAIAAQNESAAAILQAAEHAVRTDFNDLEVTTEHFSAPVDEVLVELSAQACLVVLGCDDVTPGAAILVGSTTMSIATRSSCPVIAWRGEETALNRLPIVLGVDGEDSGRSAIATAFELADRFGVNLVAVHAWSTRRPPGDVTLPSMIDWNAMEADEQQHLSDKLAPWVEKYPGVEVSFVVDPESPSRALLRHLESAQLVVVGSRGRGLVTGSLLGSTGLNLLHHASIPVMICRPAKVENDHRHQPRPRTGVVR